MQKLYRNIEKWVFILLAFISCRKIDENGYKTYTIKKGKHRSGYRFSQTKSNHIEFFVLFDESAEYTSKDSVNQYDVNKLFGLSDCGTNHMENSIRFGWRWINDQLQLLWFKHEEGKFTFEPLRYIDINQPYKCSIELTEDYYILGIEGTYFYIDRPCSQNFTRYYLYPYFGGDETAPHDITIRIKE
jgi:hypothetical protein